MNPHKKNGGLFLKMKNKHKKKNLNVYLNVFAHRIGVLERDVMMKRQLVEDLRSRLKICQDSERSHRAVTEDLEKKVGPARTTDTVLAMATALEQPGINYSLCRY